MTTEQQQDFKRLQALNLNLNNFYEDFLQGNECLLHYIDGARESLYSLESCYSTSERVVHDGLCSQEEFIRRVSERHLTNAFEYLQDFCKVSRLKDATDNEEKAQYIELFLKITDLMQQVLVLMKNTKGVEAF